RPCPRRESPVRSGAVAGSQSLSSRVKRISAPVPRNPVRGTTIPGMRPRLPVPKPLPRAQPPWSKVLVVGLAGALLGLALLGLQLARLGGGETAPFFVGTAWGFDEELAARGIEVRTVPGTGYDGQWFLGLAYDPLLLDHTAD